MLSPYIYCAIVCNALQCAYKSLTLMKLPMKLLTPLEYSRKYNIPYRTVRSWITRGKIPVVRKTVTIEKVFIQDKKH